MIRWCDKIGQDGLDKIVRQSRFDQIRAMKWYNGIVQL